MRLSCNGCRVLRKGCSEDCTLRPCLDWIDSPSSQANATVFLAKFYGRAGLMNLINVGPPNLRPAVLRSLLHEACGRILNPVYGSVGLMWSGNWQVCVDAVEAVLRGESLTQRIEIDGDHEQDVKFGSSPNLMAACDLRHVGRGGKRLAKMVVDRVRVGSEDADESPSHVESGLSQADQTTVSPTSPEKSELVELPDKQQVGEERFGSDEPDDDDDDVDGIDLDLSLGLEPMRPRRRKRDDDDDDDDDVSGDEDGY